MSKTSELKQVSELARVFKKAKVQTSIPYRKFVTLISLVPKGSVASYGQIAALADCPGHARQVVRALHSSSTKYRLPWHRIINSQGKIGIRNKISHLQQKGLLLKEGVKFNKYGVVDLKQFGWQPRRAQLKKLFKLLK